MSEEETLEQVEPVTARRGVEGVDALDDVARPPDLDPWSVGDRVDDGAETRQDAKGLISAEHVPGLAAAIPVGMEKCGRVVALCFRALW